MIRTDIIIIGAGPCGLFTVFEAGLLKLKCHIIDALPAAGGQLTELYPKKPIYDIPGYPVILAKDLVDNLMEQIAPFNPGFTLGERAETIDKTGDKEFTVMTNKGTVVKAPVIAIAAGLGSFEPRKPVIENLESYEDKGIDYIIKDPNKYADKKVVIAGGGDSALDWAIDLSNIAAELTLVHRRTAFRGAPDSVDKVHDLAKKGALNLITEGNVTSLRGEGKLEGVSIKTKEDVLALPADYFIPLFGMTPKLGPIAEWGLNLDRSTIEVDSMDFSTNIPGIYAIGDINTYPGKLKLILCGFHEGTMMAQSAFKYIHPDEKLTFKYTTVTGIKGLT